VAQFPDGETTHRIQIRNDKGILEEVHVFKQFTKNGEVLIFKPEVPLEGVIAVHVDTLKSPSWVAWAEIEVYGE
jgi:hypothetical protein